MVLWHALVGPVDHLHRLLELDAAAVVLVDADVEHEALAAQELEALDEVVRQARPVGLVLEQVAEAPDLGPGVAGGLAHALNVALHDGGPAGQGRPRDVGGAQRGVLLGVALAVPRLAGGDAPDPVDLHQRVLPAAAVPGAGLEVDLAVRLEEDEALDRRGRGRDGRLVLLQGVLLGQGPVGLAPCQRLQLRLWVQVDVGVDDGNLRSHDGIYCFAIELKTGMQMGVPFCLF